MHVKHARKIFSQHAKFLASLERKRTLESNFNTFYALTTALQDEKAVFHLSVEAGM